LEHIVGIVVISMVDALM